MKKLNKVTMIMMSKISWGIGKIIGKPNCSLCTMVWVVTGTGTALTEKVAGERKNKKLYLFFNVKDSVLIP